MEDKGYVRQKNERKKMARQINPDIKYKEEKMRTKIYAEKRIGNAKKARRSGEEKDKSRDQMKDKKNRWVEKKRKDYRKKEDEKEKERINFRTGETEVQIKTVKKGKREGWLDKRKRI